jgi:hypothetical protein
MLCNVGLAGLLARRTALWKWRTYQVGDPSPTSV